MDYETYREERKSSNKAIKTYLKGVRDEKQGDKTTRFSLSRQLDKYLTYGWSELAPNEKKFFELLEQIRENERRQNTYRDDISQRGVGSIDIPAADAESVANRQLS